MHNSKETKELILDTSIELFARHSFANVSMSDIAEACGLTKPSIYYHFNNKQGLFIALAQRIYERIKSELMTIIELDLPLRETLILIGEVRFESLEKQPDLVRTHLSFLFVPDIRDLIDSLQDDIMALQQAIIPKFTEAIAIGEIKSSTDPLLTSIMFHSTLNTYLIRALHGCMDSEKLPAAETVVDAILDGISTENYRKKRKVNK